MLNPSGSDAEQILQVILVVIVPCIVILTAVVVVLTLLYASRRPNPRRNEIGQALNRAAGSNRKSPRSPSRIRGGVR